MSIYGDYFQRDVGDSICIVFYASAPRLNTDCFVAGNCIRQLSEHSICEPRLWTYWVGYLGACEAEILSFPLSLHRLQMK